jgi:hypothetical protein
VCGWELIHEGLVGGVGGAHFAVLIVLLLAVGEVAAVVAVHGPRARAHGPGWAGFFLQAHAMSPWAHAISLCGLRLGQI